ncbi:MAG: biotin transporter BioY [Actinomycetota bacterium]
MSTLAQTLAPPRSRTAARLGFEGVCALAGSLLIGGLAQLSIHLPFTPVPITGQTLGVLLVGAAYGPGLGATTVLVYLAMAVAGLPVLAPDENGAHAGGSEVLRTLSVTGGYLWGFALGAGLVGWLSRRGWDRTFGSAIGAMLLGSVVIYAVGVPWLMAAADLPLAKGLEFGMYPFVIGDLLKLLAAAGLLPLVWAAMSRFRPRDDIGPGGDGEV